MVRPSVPNEAASSPTTESPSHESDRSRPLLDASSPSPLRPSEHPARRRAPLARRFLRLSPMGPGSDPIVEAPRAVAAVARRERRYRRGLAATDVLAVTTALLAA